MKDKILFILGNGPSLGEIMNDEKNLNILRQHDTFGLNAAYRMYDKYNFYPTYFGCFDFVVNNSHKKNFEKLVLEKNPIKKFFFIGNRESGQKFYSPKVFDKKRFQKFNFVQSSFQKMSCNFTNFVNIGSSGANAAQVGIILGYKKIVLLGCDCNYVEKVDGVQVIGGTQIKLTKNLNHNPNYWFPEYQQKGDTFNLPQTAKFQVTSWKNLYMYCPEDVSVINGSIQSKISFFPKKQFTEIVQ